MVFDFISKWNNEPKPYLSLMLAGMSFFLYFFRNRFGKKFEDRKNQDKPNQS